MRGIPRQAVEENPPIKGTEYHASDVADRQNSCKWNSDMWGVDMTKPGAQAYYDSIAELYASWGVDFIKADDMGSHQYQPAEIKALSSAIKNSGRPMLLSISPGPSPISEAGVFEKYAQMWRISDDFWDNWKPLRRQFDYARDWAPYVGKNETWPDADMLPLGKLRVTSTEGGGSPTKFTPDEQQTLMTLWCIRSPLIFGGDLSSNDESTTALITNEEVLAVDQHSANSHQEFADENIRVWVAEIPGSRDRYLAVFNIGEKHADVHLDWKRLAIPGSTARVRNLWRRRTLGTQQWIHAKLSPHSSALYRVYLEP